MPYVHQKSMKMFIPHIIVLSGRTEKASKQVQRGFERAEKGDGLDLIVVRGLN